MPKGTENKSNAISPRVVERLKESKRKADEELFTRGEQHGTQWAESQAEAKELDRLARAWQDRSAGKFSWIGSPGTEAAEEFHRIIRPDVPSQSGREFFVEEVFDDADELACLADEPSFIHGFAAGAVNIYSAVESRI